MRTCTVVWYSGHRVELPEWWPEGTSVDDVACKIIGKETHDAEHMLHAADLFTNLRREDGNNKGAPTGYNPVRIQMTVNKGKVISYEVG